MLFNQSQANILITVERDDLCDYDMDSNDIAWMQKQPKHWKLSVEMFERIIEWLENECERNVPSLEALLSQPFVKDISFFICEAVYDYWLERRLVGKRRLLYRVKQENAQR